MTSLTPELLSKRIIVLNERLGPHATDEQRDELGFLICDRCGLKVDLLNVGFPRGWTTAGDFAQGFTDLCNACSS